MIVARRDPPATILLIVPKAAIIGMIITVAGLR